MDDAPTTWPTSVTLWLAAVMIAGGVIFDVATPTPYTGDSLLAGACVLSGATQRARTALVMSLIALTVIIVLTVKAGDLGDGSGLFDIVNVLLSVVIGLGVNRVLSRSGRRLATVRSVAEAAQRALLPDPPVRLGPLAIAARYEAAQSGARIGGDVYAAQRTRYGVRLLIADVRGKGMGAVATVAVLLGAFREAADDEPDLACLALRLDRALDREAVRQQGEEHLEGFVTGLLAEFVADPGAAGLPGPPGLPGRAGSPGYGAGAGAGGGVLRLLNRGHPPPYLLHGAAVRPLEPGTPDLPFGMTGLGGIRSAADELAFPPGATLLLVTDGVTETRDRDGVFYDPRDRLPGLGPFRGPQHAIDALLADLAAWTGGAATADDRAVLAVSLD